MNHFYFLPPNLCFVWLFVLLSGAEADSDNHPRVLRCGEVPQRLWSLTCPYKYISNCAVVARTSAGEAAGADSENTTNKPLVPNSDGKHTLFIPTSPDLQDRVQWRVNGNHTTAPITMESIPRGEQPEFFLNCRRVWHVFLQTSHSLH